MLFIPQYDLATLQPPSLSDVLTIAQFSCLQSAGVELFLFFDSVHWVQSCLCADVVNYILQVRFYNYKYS